MCLNRTKLQEKSVIEILKSVCFENFILKEKEFMLQGSTVSFITQPEAQWLRCE